MTVIIFLIACIPIYECIVIIWMAFLDDAKPLKIKCVNKKTALCLSLLKGDIITVANSIRLTGYSNPAREIPREVEDVFHVEVDRKKVEAKDQFGNYVTWHQYHLNVNKPENLDGIKLMREYVKQNVQLGNPKTTAEAKQFKQIQLSLQ